MKKFDPRKYFPVSWRDFGIYVVVMCGAALACLFMRNVAESDEFPSLIFMMAVLLISRYTNGYLFGLMASATGVALANYFFTYPYREFNVLITGYPLTFAVMLLACIITCTLTSRIKREENLRIESEREKMRANLLRSVSHDIRTPLTSIAGAASILLEQPEGLSTEERRKLLEDVRDESQWLIQVVENLLSITRFGRGENPKINTELVSAEEVLGETVGKFRKRFPNVAVEVEAPEDLLTVSMDHILIEQVLLNLLENAVIHGKTTTCIRMSVRRDGAWARFDVKDDGCGIPSGQLPNLFDGSLPQDREDRGDKKRNMGLGLAVCTSIVRAHGGTMRAVNLPRGGADISFRLPISKEEQRENSR